MLLESTLIYIILSINLKLLLNKLCQTLICNIFWNQNYSWVEGDIKVDAVRIRTPGFELTWTSFWCIAAACFECVPRMSASIKPTAPAKLPQEASFSILSDLATVASIFDGAFKTGPQPSVCLMCWSPPLLTFRALVTVLNEYSLRQDTSILILNVHLCHYGTEAAGECIQSYQQMHVQEVVIKLHSNSSQCWNRVEFL